MAPLRIYKRKGAIMRPTDFSAEAIATLLRKQKIARMPKLMGAMGTNARRTVFRKLKELAYRTSYSHCGRYYTLDEVAEFDEQGLWSYREVWFSVYGTLLSTAAAMVEAAAVGYFVEELDNRLHVGTKDALRKLVGDARLTREKVAGQFLYCAADSRRRRQQLLARRSLLAEPGVVGAIPEAAILPDELRAAIVLFFSLLDEKQRRLYAGLEAHPGRRRREQQFLQPRLEVRVTNPRLRPPRSQRDRGTLSERCLQVESHRTPPLQRNQQELGCPPVGQLRDHPQVPPHHDHWATGSRTPRPQGLQKGRQDHARTDGRVGPDQRRGHAQVELHPTACRKVGSYSFAAA